MQKKLIALAVAGLLSAPAFAQSNVTIYGTIDYGYAYTGRHSGYADGGGNKLQGDNRYKSRSAIDSGISKANRIGFKGVEDLGNGLKAVFVLETGLNGDVGGLFKDGNARQSYAALAGGFGTVAFGRHYTPQHLFTTAVDPFAKNGLGSSANVYVQDKRLNNLVAYISPSWSGFSFIAGWTWNGLVQEYSNKGTPGGLPAGLGDRNVRVWAFAPSFTWNNLFIGLNYHRASVENRIGTPGNSHRGNLFWAGDLFVSYDFGPVKLGAAYGRRKTSKGLTNLLWNIPSDSKVDQLLVGLTANISSKDKVLFSYNYARDDFRPRAKISQVALGYEHSLSKRTALYTQFAWQNQNKAYKEYGGRWTPTTDSVEGGVGASNLSGEGTSRGYRQGFTVGIRHDF